MGSFKLVIEVAWYMHMDLFPQPILLVGMGYHEAPSLDQAIGGLVPLHKPAA